VCGDFLREDKNMRLLLIVAGMLTLAVSASLTPANDRMLYAPVHM
jgi:hypothetical protein